ncbi:nucleoside hydrolase [Bacillus safensis]|uniref:nucleoside hydrolase n=1 Tax=Bacillus TaxID=1386 RepID=UPI00046A570F|nr:nucleoside hydrolase [Bacillus safensis]MBZ9521803.1 nucleoside hydrolase [Bacillus safensis]MCY7704121.1 nucleoside hydrolase [Bacillus safensis]MCY7720126.1 nucleoside hydrolase [Bacillus safensis]MED0729570.1 nucleoside hydrolase [Bacillus safensis]WEZ16818.1 nucleoside hydrolase [Bacillus safensis]
MANTKKLILDVDTGIDDAIGILLAVKSKQFDILGITTVCGNVSVDAATLNTCKVLELVEADNIPVIKGSATPLLRAPHYEHRVHGEDGIGGALKDVRPKKTADAGFAPDFIIEQVLQYSNQVTLVLTGPLTNLALAIKKCPELIHHVKEVIFMGGVVKGQGNVSPVAEFNTYADPEAAKLVLDAGFPSLTQVGLDVTRQVLLTDERIDAIQNETLAAYIRESTSIYRQRYFERNGVWACAMHDPLAVSLAINKELVSTQAFHVEVETKSEFCDGQMICDFQHQWEKERNVQVCMDVDDEAFFDLLIKTMNS